MTFLKKDVFIVLQSQMYREEDREYPLSPDSLPQVTTLAGAQPI